MKAVIDRVMSQPELLAKPPVCIDIGASGNLFSQWRLLAPYSICVAFDADDRDFTVSESEQKGWGKLYLMNRLVSDKASDSVDFYLTKSPYCSSSLLPDNAALKPWEFWPLFEVEKVVKLSAVDLPSVLAKIGIDYIDWYKTDSQGTDLRIFKSLTEKIQNNIITAEFEPGIIDAYRGEDKLHHLLAYMDNLPFWISSMNILGAKRIDQKDFSYLKNNEKMRIGCNLKTAPGWCEISYINTLCSDVMTCREYLLGWVFSMIKEEYGFASKLARTGAVKFHSSIFDELYDCSCKSLLRRDPVGSVLRAVKKTVRLIVGRV